MTVAVVGLGFVGLTTALGLAEKGHTVYGFDISADRTKMILHGEVPFYEPGLAEALQNHLQVKFHIAKSMAEAVVDSSVVFFCVGTPGHDDGSADLTQLLKALDSAAGSLADGKYRVLVIKSTVPPGTTEDRIRVYLENTPGDYSVAVNPEFLREGKCWDDFMHPDRIVCGVNDARAAEAFTELYRPFKTKVHLTTPSTAEYIKYLSNSLLAALISYSNEMALIGEAIGGIMVSEAFHILHEDKRWNGAGITSYIYPGCGYGGYCLPKDTRALAAQAAVNGVKANILQEVIALNDRMPGVMADRIARSTSLDSAVGVLGLSFKPDSDDVRDSPAAKIIEKLIAKGYSEIYAYDPAANAAFDAMYSFPQVTYCQNKESVCTKSAAIALVTAWGEFAGCKDSFKDKQWIDCRYFFAG